ncbi:MULTISPECIES: hypothetical protein [Paenibacillus]|uniref:Uncharacterized protein n=1 Tax=Paenibacillus pabuli TaxID=1472 RepID=A0A855Y735_9BACL|nr:MULTISPECIES: hypothetical protein [Paenibacillus]PWW45271.1 hypothetical protein DET56_101473 [Paenibacillus pabuli]PXW11608.1 hypothetical protein DEU73_101472 [Paenibacillus taichungensis]RAI92300.1 hypothetical protein DET54_1105 [Paenibacillus pabuli]
MAIISHNLPAGVGKSFYENLSGGANATVAVNNFGPAAVSLVITRVDAPVVTYVIPVNSGLIITASGVLVFALLANQGGDAVGTIEVTLS